MIRRLPFLDVLESNAASMLVTKIVTEREAHITERTREREREREREIDRERERARER